MERTQYQNKCLASHPVEIEHSKHSHSHITPKLDLLTPSSVAMADDHLPMEIDLPSESISVRRVHQHRQFFRAVA
eukprot:scaffold115232_cov63-Cyclotella_meneghiniana.AAC.4